MSSKLCRVLFPVHKNRKLRPKSTKPFAFETYINISNDFPLVKLILWTLNSSALYIYIFATLRQGLQYI